MGEEGHALGWRVAVGGQHVDDRGVDGAAARGREQRRGELTHLVVGEAVVGRRARGVLDEKAREDGGCERLREHLGLARLLV